MDVVNDNDILRFNTAVSKALALTLLNWVS